MLAMDPPALSTLTYRQTQLVTLFVSLAKRAGRGATWRELADVLGLTHMSAALRSLVDTLVRYRIVYARRRRDLPRSPWYFFAHSEAWQEASPNA